LKVALPHRNSETIYLGFRDSCQHRINVNAMPPPVVIEAVNLAQPFARADVDGRDGFKFVFHS
jgi:hypothetical protein